MRVPDEVIAAAEERYWVAGREQDAYAYVAEWARKETLKDAAFVLGTLPAYFVAGRGFMVQSALVEESISEIDREGE